MITLSDGSTAITLTDDLLRTDEHGWSPVRQGVTPTLTGALVIDVSVLQAGEPITLAGARQGPDGLPYGLISRADFSRLRAMSAQPGKVWSLTLRGVTYQVVWRHEDPPALDAQDLIDYSDPEDSDWVIPVLKFTRVS